MSNSGMVIDGNIQWVKEINFDIWEFGGINTLTNESKLLSVSITFFEKKGLNFTKVKIKKQGVAIVFQPKEDQISHLQHQEEQDKCQQSYSVPPQRKLDKRKIQFFEVLPFSFRINFKHK
ncbi:hypothetical protein ACTA71_004141 [Dictyostelium dimigraforme]